ncbi:MAG: RluA family pseudouridine synthase [Paracoccaceae bacterium]
MSDYAPPDAPIDVLHADHEILVVDKPAGLLSVPGKGPELADCLIARLAVAFPTILLVHRLDRDTSGVMVFALTPHAQRHLGQQFEKRRAKKEYLARLHGEMVERSGTVDAPLMADWPNRPRQMIHPDGRAAVTDWHVLRRGGGETRARLVPHTGRSHQLRVHMLSLGHPILGDSLYAPDPGAHSRMMLHSHRLRLRHPDGGRGGRFTAPPPF